LSRRVNGHKTQQITLEGVSLSEMPIGIGRKLPNFIRKNLDLIGWLFWFVIRLIKEFWGFPLWFLGKDYTVEVAN